MSSIDASPASAQVDSHGNLCNSAYTVIIESERFWSFEHAGWESIPDQYHQAFGNLTTQAVGPLLDAARVKRGVKFLDIASGPGYVAAAAAKRGATVLGIDFSSAMLTQAQLLHPGIDFRQGDAEQLPLGNGLFDAAAMNFSILHLGHPGDLLFLFGVARRRPSGSTSCCARWSHTVSHMSNCPKGRRFFVTAIQKSVSAA
ncbi:MAG: class I SAM-dependent methyltransferase [Deltaproteobacteria bacterium]|nr:MAG: class I SAM-dependent methyltransferase [Deltaproteobacteria bacterium]